MILLYTIIIYSGRKNERVKSGILQLLLQTLSNGFCINLISQKLLSTGNTGKEQINIIETTDIKEIATQNSILIIKNNANIKALKFIDKSTNVIIDSGNTKNIINLSKTLSKVYSCGFSSKDCVTFSSKEDEKAVVSLQRSVTNLKNEICEPLEIPCTIHGRHDDFSILATSLTAILLGLI